MNYNFKFCISLWILTVHDIFSDNKSVKLACNSDWFKTAKELDFVSTISYQLIVTLPCMWLLQYSVLEALYTRYVWGQYSDCSSLIGYVECQAEKSLTNFIVLLELEITPTI